MEKETNELILLCDSVIFSTGEVSFIRLISIINLTAYINFRSIIA